MNLRRLRVGEWILGVSGALLLVSLFLPWWGLEGDWIGLGPGGPIEGADQGPGVVTTWTAWQVFSVADVFFALLGVSALVVWVLVARWSAPGLGLAGEALATPLAFAMAIVALVQVLGTPGSLEAPPTFDATVEYGGWLGLLSTFGVAVGLLVGMRDERLSRSGETTDQTGAPISKPIAVETLPGPPPA
jgi:hypothetical protein